MYWISDRAFIPFGDCAEIDGSHAVVNVGSWQTAASFVALGLTWWESILAVLLGSTLISILIVLNGASAQFSEYSADRASARSGIIGARLHTPFAVTARAPFGYGLAKFAVISRMLLAWFWFSINTFQ